MPQDFDINSIPERKEKPIRVLHVFGRLGLGGAESRIMDLYRNIDKSQVQFDFLVHSDAQLPKGVKYSSQELMKVRKPEYFDEEIKRLGGNIYAVPRLNSKNILTYKGYIESFFKANKGKWAVVQGHMTSTAAIYLPIAKKYGAGITASHVRSGGTDPGLKGKLTEFLRRPFKKEGVCDYYLSCTEAAARHVYGDELVDAGKVRVIPNAINVDKFAYSEDIRNKIRNELGISNAIVIGHVGRFHYAKNHEFLIRVFAQIVQLIREDDKGRYTLIYGLPLRLMLLGEGPLMEDTKKLVHELGMDNRVLFLGNKSNVSDYYQAMDYFCFPSRYEGLPGTVVEAQAAGLQCLVSDSITTEVDITRLVSRMSIELDPRQWAMKVLDDLVPRMDVYAHEVPDERFDNAFDRIYDKDQGFGRISDGMGKVLVDLPEEHPYDRAHTSGYLADAIKKAGFDAKTQAAMMTYFYRHGSFRDDATRNLREVP